MRRRALLAFAIASSLTLAGCNKLAELSGVSGPTVTNVSVYVPAGLLLGDSAQAHASAVKSNGVNIPELTPDVWRSSNPSVISISSKGVMKAVALGQATIFADFQGKTGSSVVTVGGDDARLGYAFADQETATSPYAPAASTRFNSSGGAITVTRTNVGLYTVTFAGLGRPPGGRDNVQVTGVAGGPVYCKPTSWDATSADLVVSVRCIRKDASFADSKFTVLAIGARAFGASTPLGFVLSDDATFNVNIDTAATTHNSAGGSVIVGHGTNGLYSIALDGLGPQSGGAAGPVGIMVSGTGPTGRRCQADGLDFATSAIGVECHAAGGGAGDNGFSMLWFTRGRIGFRYGYALAQGSTSTVAYAPQKSVSANSSGGAITAKKTGAGTYQIVFAGLARPAGGADNVQVAAFGATAVFCTLSTWSNSGANDLVANVTCWDTFDAPADGIFSILIVQ